MLILTQSYSNDKITKVGGTAKGKRMVTTRQKREATENQIAFRIDRADNQRENRREKRKGYKL